MNCLICLEAFDHSIHKPHSLSSCPHTVCIACLEKCQKQKCPICQTEFNKSNQNLGLLELIPFSDYDNLKIKGIKSIIGFNEIKEDLKRKREQLVISNQDELNIFRKKLTNQSKILNSLIEKCNLLASDLNSDLASKKYENRGSKFG